MKSNYLFILFLCSFCFGQNKENVYFLYEGKTGHANLAITES